MVIGRRIWWLAPLCLGIGFGANTETATADCIISLFDPYRHLRPVCLADLDPRSCQRIPVAPQSVPDRSCVSSDTRTGQSCVASAIAKSEATLEERLQDLKESLAQDGVIPDDFVTFEAWKSGQLKAERESHEAKSTQSEDTVTPQEADRKAPTQPAQQSNSHETSVNGSAQSRIESIDTELSLSGSTAGLPHSKHPSAPQKTPHLAPHRYNYASPDCSARIHSASPQSQHASSVLHKSRDRYMLTPCSAREHWVIIELCDDIRIEAVEIGMFEFFSGIVKEVRVSIGGADDDAGEDEAKSEWQEVGRFVGRSIRGTQLFTLDYPTSFHRFIRLDFPAHYGNEYYCPISTIKVYGMNQMEAFKWESRKQKETEIARRRLEEEVKRAQQTVTIAGTLLQVSSAPPPTSSVPLATIQSSSISAISVSPQTMAADQSSAAVVPASEAIGTPTQVATSLQTVRRPAPTQSRDASPLIGKLATETSASTIMEPSTTVPRLFTTGNGYKPSSARAQTAVISSHSAAFVSPSQGTAFLSSLDSSAKVFRDTPAVSGTPRSEGKADTSESIYAYIIRRLNTLEGNSTLGMMYMEEQTKATRSILQKLENSLTDWKVQMETTHQMAIQQERSSWEKTLDSLVRRMEQRDALLERETRSLRSHIRQLRQEISWERRRNYLHISATVVMAFVLYLSAQGRPSSLQHDMADPGEPSSSDTELYPSDKSRLLSSPPDWRVENLRETHARDYSRNRIPSSSRMHLRRPSTPIAQKYRYKPPTVSLIQPSSEHPHIAHSKNFDEVRLSSSLSGASRPSGQRRMGRSAHLHTLSNATRLQHRHSHPDTDLSLLDGSKAGNKLWVEQAAAKEANVADEGGSVRASASEADDDMGGPEDYLTDFSP